MTVSMLQQPGQHTLASARRSEGGGGGQYVVVQQRVGAASCPVHSSQQEVEECEGDALRAPALIRSSSAASAVTRPRHTAPASPSLATIKEAHTFTQHQRCSYFESGVCRRA